VDSVVVDVFVIVEAEKELDSVVVEMVDTVEDEESVVVMVVVLVNVDVAEVVVLGEQIAQVVSHMCACSQEWQNIVVHGSFG
jgi:hypothetical protein